MSETNYQKLRAVNVNDRIEKKNGLSYLSWAFAVDTLLQHDPTATWTYAEPKKFGETLMVFCSVTAFGKTMTAQLPVMDHRNKAIVNPDAFSVNTAMQRCLAKAIALHGLGLYIYAGEDLPEEPENQHNPRGELGKNIAQDQARTTATQMRGVLELDIDEDLKAMKAADIHDFLRTQHDLYVAASDEMTAAERRQWKALVKLASDREAHERGYNGRM